MKSIQFFLQPINRPIHRIIRIYTTWTCLHNRVNKRKTSVPPIFSCEPHKALIKNACQITRKMYRYHWKPYGIKTLGGNHVRTPGHFAVLSSMVGRVGYRIESFGIIVRYIYENVLMIILACGRGKHFNRCEPTGKA